MTYEEIQIQCQSIINKCPGMGIHVRDDNKYFHGVPGFLVAVDYPVGNTKYGERFQIDRDMTLSEFIILYDPYIRDLYRIWKFTAEKAAVDDSTLSDTGDGS